MPRLLTMLALVWLFAGSAWADARSDLEAGKAALARGDDAAAVSSFGRAISGGLQGAELAAAHKERGRSFLRIGDLTKAMEDLTRAIELNPDDGDAYGLRCRVNLGLNNANRALADGEAAFARTDSSIAAHTCRAEILYASRRFKESLASYDEAMRLGANDYQFRSNRLLAMIWAGRPKEALRELDVLIESARGAGPSTEAKLYEVRARARLGNGELDAALGDADRAIQLADGRGVLHAERLAFRARIHVLKANFNEAIADIDAALALLANAREDRLAPLYAMRAGARATQGQLDRAIADFDEAIRRGKDVPGPQVADWHVGRARANVALGRRDAAAQDFDHAVRLDSGNPALLIERGDNKLHRGDAAGALADYDAALQLNPASVGANSRRGWALLDLGRYDEAIAAATRLVQQEPQKPIGYWDRGVFRFLAGRFAESGSDFQQVVRLAPTNLHAMMWAYLADGRAGNAQTRVLAEQVQAAQANGVELQAWPGPLVQALVGTSSPQGALAAVTANDPERRRRQECEAHFYLGQQALLRNDTAAAEEHFRQAVATDVREFVEYTAARVELQRMGR